MTLSRLALPLTDRESYRRLSDLYLLHQMIMGGFKRYDPKEVDRVLFRLEPETEMGKAIVIVQSERVPSWNHLPENILREHKFYEPEAANGEVFVFRLRANPVVTRNGKRYGLVRYKPQLEWLAKKKIGVKWLHVDLRDEGYKTGKKEKIRFKSVLYEGYLRVTDAHRLNEALHKGVGPAKGFGFGLLSLAKA